MLDKSRHRLAAVSPVLVLVACLALAGCGRKGALEAPPGEASPRAEPKTNTFFSTPPAGASARVKAPVGDMDPANLPMNPQLGAGGAVVRVSPAVSGGTAGSAVRPGIAPVGGGRKAKRILPPKDSFILDPLL